jgi:hypothetical protein
MRYYTAKNDTREYIVLQHALPGANLELCGVRYRDGYAVVARGSKEHGRLKQIRLAISKEFPITHLNTLKFITNDRQVEIVWGKAVFNYYVTKKAAKANKPEQLNKTNCLCSASTALGTSCKSEALKGYLFCRKHVSNDIRIQADLEAAGRLTKQEKSELLTELIDKYRV